MPIAALYKKLNYVYLMMRAMVRDTIEYFQVTPHHTLQQDANHFPNKPQFENTSSCT